MCLFPISSDAVVKRWYFDDDDGLSAKRLWPCGAGPVVIFDSCCCAAGRQTEPVASSCKREKGNEQLTLPEGNKYQNHQHGTVGTRFHWRSLFAWCVTCGECISAKYR